jgi:hypothetical protein
MQGSSDSESGQVIVPPPVLTARGEKPRWADVFIIHLSGRLLGLEIRVASLVTYSYLFRYEGRKSCLRKSRVSFG